ncbi:hypothetical protein [Rhizobacter fulvus]|jgi:hypothetical protein
MLHETHSARVTGPLRVVAHDGQALTIPVGPCLIEELDGDMVDLVWGRAGEKSVVVPTVEVESAERDGTLVRLD